MVITRDEYLGAPRQSGALYGLLQAMLLTKVMLFVGYSLSDEDFHGVMSDVRDAIPRWNHQDAPDGVGSPSGGGDRTGRVLVLREEPLFDALWTDQTNVIPVSSAREGLDDASSGRLVQVFLDLVGFRATDASAFLLDDTYEALLDEDERHLKSAITHLWAETRGLQGATGASPMAGWKGIESQLFRLGLDPQE